MTSPLIALDALPTETASRVKNKWGDVVRQVQNHGSLAITSHSNVELVMLSAQAYQEMTELLARAHAREHSEIEALESKFRTRLAVLEKPDAHGRLDRLFAAKGKVRKPPIAGHF